jgi:hypothetical protein
MLPVSPIRGTWDVGRGTWDVGRGTWDVGRGTWDVGGDSHQPLAQTGASAMTRPPVAECHSHW